MTDNHPQEMNNGTPDLPDDQPNVVLVLSDDHTTQAISSYAGDPALATVPSHLADAIETANIDRIGEEGIRFNNTFCTNSICAPARATVMSGTYGHHNGVRVNPGRFDDSQWAFTNELRDNDYQTGLIGKWHLGSGYDRSLGPPPGFDHWEVLEGQGSHWDPVLFGRNHQTQYEGYTTDIITDRSLHWIDQLDEDKPFFLQVGYKGTHAPFHPAERYLEAFDTEIPPPETLHDDYETRTEAIENALKIGPTLYNTSMRSETRGDLPPIPEDLSDKETVDWVYQRFIRNYLGAVAGIDHNVGRLLAYLNENGLADNTIVIYTADHGFFAGEHGLYDKRYMYEPALRIPLLIRWPAVIAGGATEDAITTNLDFAPTLLEATGTDPPGELQGRSWMPLLMGEESAPEREPIYYRYYEEKYGGLPHEGIRSQQYKLIHYHTINEWELYDLESDPQELENRYGDPAYSGIQAKLEGRLEQRRRNYGIPLPTEGGSPGSD